MKSKWSILSTSFLQKYFDIYPQNNSIYVTQYKICLWEEKKKNQASLACPAAAAGNLQDAGVCPGSAGAAGGSGAACFHLWQPRCC